MLVRGEILLLEKFIVNALSLGSYVRSTTSVIDLKYWHVICEFLMPISKFLVATSSSNFKYDSVFG